jgi:hypothetical protein
MHKFAIVAMVLTALLSGLVTQTASADPVSVAATCSGTGCDNRDPAQTGCDDSAITVDTDATSKGTFLLRYSTVCRTNWVHIGSYAGGSSRPDGKLELRVEDHDRGVGFSYFASSTAGTHWGNMVYSPGSNCAVGSADWNLGAWDAVMSSSGC